MESSQCVPSWDVDDPPSHLSSNLPLRHYQPSDEPLHPLDLGKSYEVAELTWENGHLALHGLVPPRSGRANPKNPPVSGAVAEAAEPWNKHHHRSGTLEAVVDQAAGAALPGGGPDVDEWFGGLRGGRPSAAAVDALVPCQDDATERFPDPVESGRPKRPRVACSSQGSAVGSLVGARVESTTLVTLGTCREDDDFTLNATATTDTNTASPETESTSLGRRKALAPDDNLSNSQTSSQNKLDSLHDDEEKTRASKLEAEKASASTKKRRAAAIHNQSERKRRDRINQRIKTLQKLVPNSSKTDKASMLDEVIEYLKQLQAQIQMMSRMNNMMMPMAALMAAPGQIQAVPMMAAAHLAHMAQLQQQLPPPQLAGMAVPGMLDLASLGARPLMPPSLPPMLHPSAFITLPTVAAAAATVTAGAWDGSIPFQMPQKPLRLEEYSRMAAFFEQMYQQQPPPSS